MNIIGAAMQAKTSQATAVALIYGTSRGVCLSFRPEPVSKLLLPPHGRTKQSYEFVA